MQKFSVSVFADVICPVNCSGVTTDGAFTYSTPSVVAAPGTEIPVTVAQLFALTLPLANPNACELKSDTICVVSAA